MGSNGSKASSSCSSSATTSASGSFRKGRSKGFRGFHSYCLGTSSASHDSDNEDQVCDDQSKVNGSDVAYADGNLTNSEEVETKSFTMVKAGEREITCLHSSINLDEWNERRILNPNTSSGTGTSSVHASSTYSLNPTSRFLSRFSLIPGNTSFRLSRLTSLGSSRACPVSSASLSIFDNEDEHNLHPEPCSSLINRNETRQCSGLLPPSFVNPIPTECNEDTLNNLRPNSLGSGFPSNMQSNPTGGIGTREGLNLNLFSSTIQAETENVETRHINRQNGAREPVERNVRFSRTLSVGRLRDRVLRRSTISGLTFFPLQQEREPSDASPDTGRQAVEGDSRVSPSDHSAISSSTSGSLQQERELSDASPDTGRQAVEGDSRVSPSDHSAVSSSTSGYSPSSMSNSMFSIQNYEAETSQSGEGRYQDILEHKSNFLERSRRIRSQVRALQRLGSRFENHSGHERSCIVSGQHRSGRCTCRFRNRDNNSNDDTGARASISRIVMLAEALFEVLDEIHQQSVVLSSSPSVSSIGSVPAPINVVESLPVKLYKKLHKHQEDVSQCYICLVEYEDGDSMRVLPCHHEFHKTCIDKWLKEIHRVCPLCRGNICISDSLPTENLSG